MFNKYERNYVDDPNGEPENGRIKLKKNVR